MQDASRAAVAALWLFVALVAPPAGAAARALRQVGPGGINQLAQTGSRGYGGDRGGFGANNPLAYGQSGFLAPAVITSDVSGSSSVGAISGDKGYGDTQAAAYARGVSQSTGLAALAFSVSQEKEGSNFHSAAANAIRRSAGYQGSSFAGDIFEGSGYDKSVAVSAIRRTQADNAQLAARNSQRSAQYGSASPFDI